MSFRQEWPDDSPIPLLKCLECGAYIKSSEELRLHPCGVVFDPDDSDPGESEPDTSEYVTPLLSGPFVMRRQAVSWFHVMALLAIGMILTTIGLVMALIISQPPAH